MVKRKKIMNKKGQFLEYVFLLVIILVAVLSFATINYGVQKASEALKRNEQSEFLKDQYQRKADSIPGWFDFGVTLMFFLILIILIIAGLSTQSSFELMIVFFISIFFIGPSFYIGHKALNAILTGIPMASQSFPLLSFIINQFYLLMALFYIIQFIILFIKPSTFER